MKTSASKILALGGLCALFVGTGNVACAQGYNHQDRGNDQDQSRQNDQNYDQNYDQNNQYRQHGQDRDDRGQDRQYRQSNQYRRANQAERRRLDRLHAAYAHAATRGNYGAAERDHQHAQAIRARLHAQHEDNNQDRRDRN